MATARVLIIDDEKENVRYLTTILEENGFKDIHGAFDGAEGLKKIKALKPGLVLLDLRMPKKSGIAVFNEMKKMEGCKDIPVVILTGEGGFLKHLAELRQYHEDAGGLDKMPTEQVLARFIDSRPEAFLEKPVEPEALMAVVRRILITLEEVKEQRMAEVDAMLSRMLQRQVSFKGAVFNADEKALGFLTAMAARLAHASGALPKKMAWRSSDDRPLSLSKDEFLSLQGAITDWIYRNHQASWDHKAALGALESIEAVEKYDIGKGWPEPKL